MNRLLVNLKVISQLEAGQKLTTYGETFSISTSSIIFFQSLERWMYGESRLKTVSKIQDVLETAERFVILAESPKSQEFAQTCSSSKLTLEVLAKELKQTMIGLGNLCSTYSEDKNMTAQVEVQLDYCRRLLERSQKSLELRQINTSTFDFRGKASEK